MNHILTLNLTIFRPFILRWKISSKTLWILGFALIASLLVFYIFQVNEITKASFFIANYEKQIAKFSQESKNLESNFSHLNSSANLETILNNLNYEKVGQVHYLRVPDSTVVTK